MGQVKWTNRAISHLQAIHDYIAKDSKVYANRFVKSLIHSTKKLESMPECGRWVPEFEEKNFKEVIYSSYRIIYRILEKNRDVEILAVIHCARDFKSAIQEIWEL
jgi:plasmid stabilization system protein ParE